MITVEEIQKLPRSEKWRLMEVLWEDISGAASEDLESPTWHSEALAETRCRVVEGLEEPVDWASAKRQLLDERSCG
jgi:hypothetical protein